MLSYRPDIDGLRALAVAPVVLFHAGIPGFAGGYIGVDVFFVISGFLITAFIIDDLVNGRFSVARFYERRVRRILPALFTVILASMLVGHFMLLPGSFVALAQSAIAASVFAANIWFANVAEDYFAPAVEFMPLLHTWSLGVEEQFYIVFPLLVWFLSRWGTSAITTMIIVLTSISFVISVWAVRDQPDAAFYLTPVRAWELGIGALLALHGRSIPLTRRARELVCAVGLACIVAAVLLYDSRTPFPGTAALLPSVGAMAVIHAGGQGSTLVTRALSWRPVVLVGLISYSLYLWHWPILAFLRVRFGQVDLPVAIALLAVTVSVGFAFLSWKYVEMPFRRRPPHGPRRTTIFGAAGAATAALVVVSALVWWRMDLPSGIPADARMAYMAAGDSNPARSQCFARWPDEGLCRFPGTNDPARPPSFLLWGDSHADAIMPGVANAAGRADEVGVFAGMDACPPLRNVDRADKGPGHRCSEFNEAVLQYLQSRENISVVVLAARWALAAEAVRARGEHGSPAYLVPANSGENGKVGVEHNFELFRQGISATVDAIRSMDRRVVLVGNVPEIGWHVPAHAVARARWGDALPPAPTLDEVVGRQGRADAVLARLGERRGVHFLPIASQLCNPTCRTHIDGRPIYLDDDHLNRFGSIQVIAPLLTGSTFSASDG